MSAPTISVLMPAYNVERYVGEAIQSLCAQTFTDFELIIVDDGSTDSTRQIIEKHAAGDPRIRLISRPNTGLQRALIDATAQARGRFIARMDADDVALPDRFEKQIQYLSAHPECVLLGTRVTMIDPYGYALQEQPQHKLAHEEIDAELLQGMGGALVHPTIMMPREAFLAVGGYSTDYKTVEDLNLFLRLAERGHIANLPDVLLRYRQHFRSINRTSDTQQRQDTTSVLREAYQRRNLKMPAELRFQQVRLPEPRQQLRIWAWWALRQGNLDAARKHALQALRLSPLSPASWRVMFCAWRGR